MDFERDFLATGNPRLDAQFRFAAEIDQMTSVLRRTLLLDRSRCENDAEHSWHIAVMALLFAEHAVEKVNVLHAVEMLLVHDLVEIYAGDTFAYDAAANRSKQTRENAAADKLFFMLPQEQGERIMGLWREFEQSATPESKYANCLDKLQPFMHNMLTEGYTWKTAVPQTTVHQVRRRLSCVAEFMPSLYVWVEECIGKAVSNQWLVSDI